MKRIKKFIVLIILTLFIIGIFSTGCTKYASQEQLKALKEACDAATAAEKRIEALKTEKAQLEKQIPPKKEELDRIKKETDYIR
jgi:peptidoglycan hydrolase CwlO-like protein